MFKKILSASFLTLFIVGCAAKVPMESAERDYELKQFPAPPEGQAAVYVYRDSYIGKALTKRISINDVPIGESADKVFFYTVIKPGDTVVATASEFSDNTLEFDAQKDANYFIRQYIKMGVFIGGANLEMMSEETGKKHILNTKLAKSFSIGN